MLPERPGVSARVLAYRLSDAPVCPRLSSSRSCSVESSCQDSQQTPPSAASPRCPADCPACRLASTPSSAVVLAPAPLRPWSEVKSRRGAPKRIPTEGFACPNRQCTYFGNTDAQCHALVGDGKHGQAESIQTFRCQACRTTFTSRRDTPLYRLKPPSRAGSRWCSLRWPKDWIFRLQGGSSAFDTPR